MEAALPPAPFNGSGTAARLVAPERANA